MTALTPTEPYSQQLGRGLFAYLQPDWSYGLNNAGIFDGPRGVLLVDSAMTVARTVRLRDAAASVADGRGVHAIVSTHHHPDHTFGNCVFPTATVISHIDCRQEVTAAGLGATRNPTVDWGALTACPADVTFEKSLRLYWGDEPIDVLHLGTAHTSGDAMVWFPERKVLFSGDVIVNNSTPFFADGSLIGSLAVLDAVRDLGPEVIVPGHGPVTDQSCLEPLENYIAFTLSLAKAGITAGKEPFEIARDADLDRFGALSQPERLVGNLHRAYKDLLVESYAMPPLDVIFNQLAQIKGSPITFSVGFD